MPILGRERTSDRKCRLTDLVVLVDGGEFPEGVWESHSAVISLEVHEFPFLSSLLLIHVRLVGEAIQLRVALCKAQHWFISKTSELHEIN